MQTSCSLMPLVYGTHLLVPCCCCWDLLPPPVEHFPQWRVWQHLSRAGFDHALLLKYELDRANFVKTPYQSGLCIDRIASEASHWSLPGSYYFWSQPLEPTWIHTLSTSSTRALWAAEEHGYLCWPAQTLSLVLWTSFSALIPITLVPGIQKRSCTSFDTWREALADSGLLFWSARLPNRTPSGTQGHCQWPVLWSQRFN
jgi:hypothetical protein